MRKLFNGFNGMSDIRQNIAWLVINIYNRQGRRAGEGKEKHLQQKTFVTG
jgi:hypothetical protein